MAPTRTFGPSSKLNTVACALSLLIVGVSSARGLPLNGQTLDSAVEGVQKYLESSGFPKMTRGEILDFLNDFSRNSRVSRSEKTAADGGVRHVTTRAPGSRGGGDDEIASTSSRPAKIPRDESPLNYGYPMSSDKRVQESTAPTIFVTVKREEDSTTGDGKKKSDRHQSLQRALAVVGDGRSAQKNVAATGPTVDLNAYAEFKRIPEARNVKIDDEMKSFLNDFGLLDGRPESAGGSRASQRRNDDGNKAIVDVTTESIDEKLLKSVLRETGHDNASPRPVADRASSARDLHVFNPSNSNVKTVDVNRIAKIVENIRLLTDDDNLTASSLSHDDAFQKKLENITAAIGAIDQQPTATGDKTFNGYEVFFDDDSKELDSDLPESPATAGSSGGGGTGTGTEPLNDAQNPPDPLSTEELQQLVEKNKSDVKRQQPVANDTDTAAIAPVTAAASSAEGSVVSTSSEIPVTPVSADSTSEGTSVEVTSSVGGESRDSSTTVASADTNPSLSQLAESFGGGDTASSPPPAVDDAGTTTAFPNRPKNGLYFYVDWNSFLTVNEGQRNQVNLRFAPKAGNPAHFFRITVP